MITQLTLSEEGRILLLATWHPVDGKWRHITQIHDDMKDKFYTDGEEVLVEDEKIIKCCCK